MALLNKQITSLNGGVSQQPSNIRFDSQVEESINFYPSISKGLQRRKNMEYIGSLPTDISSDAKVEFITRGSGDKYCIVMEDSSVRVFDLVDGTERVVNYGVNAQNYLALGGKLAKESFSVLSINDTHLINNKNITVAALPVVPTPVDNLTLLYVKQGNFGKDYSVTIREKDTNITFTATYTTPKGDVSTDILAIATDAIAAQINAQILSNKGSTTITTSLKSNLIAITNLSHDFDIVTSDGFSDRAMYAIRDKITLFSDLPHSSPQDFVVKVIGDPEKSNVASNGYYVQATITGAGDPASTTSFPDVSWEETVGPNMSLGIDETTFPHSLSEQPDGTFLFDTFLLDFRTVGDDKSAVDPAFIGTNIESMFYWNGRLSVLSGVTITTSEAGNLTNFFPTSVATLLRADPIELAMDNDNVTPLKVGVPWQEKILLTSSTNQYIMQKDSALNNKTFSVTQATSFQVSDVALPVVSGSSIFFGQDVGNHEIIREFFIASRANVTDASDINIHAPTYLKSNPKALKASNTKSILAYISGDSTGELYIYKYQWQGGKKIQSSWFKYDINKAFDLVPIDCGFINDELYIIAHRDSDHASKHIIKCEFNSASRSKIKQGFYIHLDALINADNSLITKTAGTQGSYTYTLPYLVDRPGFTVIDDSDTPNRGAVMNFLIVGSNKVQVTPDPIGGASGTLTHSNVSFGYLYDSTVEKGTISMKDRNGATSVTRGRTNILQYYINYSDSYSFEIISFNIISKL